MACNCGPEVLSLVYFLQCSGLDFFFFPPVLSVLCALRLIACAARPTLSNQTGGWKRGKTATQGPSIIGGDLEGGRTLHLVSELVEMATAPSEKTAATKPSFAAK